MDMPTYYYKGSPIAAPLTITSNEPMFDGDTISLRKLRATQGAQRWEMSFTTVPQGEDIGRHFVEAVHDYHKPDSMVMPQFKEVLRRDTLKGPMFTLSQAEKGDKTFKINNDNRNSGTYPQGSFFKFYNHDKVYLNVNDIDLNGDTNRTAEIYPPLVRTVPPNTLVKVWDDCNFVFFKNIDNQRGISFSDGILTNVGTINLEEAI
jgi:hypothetical protein